MIPNTFVGFGFGAIQGGLFLAEAHATGAFERLVVAEVDPDRVSAVRKNRGVFHVNVAMADRRIVKRITGVEILNPNVPEDAQQLVAALIHAREIATALPSVAAYECGTPSTAHLLREAVRGKSRAQGMPPAIVYTAENDNHAAERLRSAVSPEDRGHLIQFLNTVVGKMSSVITETPVIRELDLTPIAPGLDQAFLVESFNHILISTVRLPGHDRLLCGFEEKEELLPFEEAKLYGHNAIHALLAYLGQERGVELMSDLVEHPDLIEIARRAFLEETGAALIRKYGGLDRLFTERGFADYAEDLLVRMLNPYLRDSIHRVTRDPLRKLGWNDRLIGAIRLALDQDIRPDNLAMGARAAAGMMPTGSGLQDLCEQWAAEGASSADVERVMKVLAGQAS